MKKYIMAFAMVFLLLTIPSISAIEYQETAKEYKSITREKIDTSFKIVESKIKTYLNSLNLERNKQDRYLGKAMVLLKNREYILEKIFEFIKSNGNFSSFNLIMALLGTIAFFVLTQPIFLQLIVETGNDFIFIGVLLSLIIIEIFQKFFALKVLGLWEPYIVNDIDGFWNFFSIVFFSIYFKIYLSYLPTFIIQYSTVFVKAFFYIIMFIIPILFNFCLADSIDLIDWNGDETPST
ncbi:MAG TPA: hypothetical protein ENI51_04815 [Candidatus Atribacteria bacterium]|nr:MAG: hypothetical protein DRN12_07590 [Thermoplasmata archaeon]HEC92302.1 hypothetical protein [Candidatus Atribacteria bacterium]